MRLCRYAAKAGMSSSARTVRLWILSTVCDQVAGEVCPVWPGQPITAHWGVADPAAFVGSEEQKRRFFHRINTELENQIKMFTSLPLASLDRSAIDRRLKEIGKTKPLESEN
jgi:hypothetical protein